MNFVTFYIIINLLSHFNFGNWGYSSAGRASGSQSEGQGFDPPYLHHIWARSSGGERLTHIQEVAGSKPAAPTIPYISRRSARTDYLVFCLDISCKSGILISVCKSFRGYSSAGRALEWHSRGQGFESPYLHQIRNLKPL